MSTALVRTPSSPRLSCRSDDTPTPVVCSPRAQFVKRNSSGSIVGLPQSPQKSAKRQRSLTLPGQLVKRESSTQRLYPMYAVPIDTLLAMDRLETHEELLRKNALVKVTIDANGDMPSVLFASHTWLDRGHPDDEKNSKLRLLQGLLRRALDGKLTITGDIANHFTCGEGKLDSASLKRAVTGGLVWFDLCSIPQANHELQLRAIRSIVSYIRDARLFFVLAGAWQHTSDGTVRDLRSWMSRGWCRLEYLANVLAPTDCTKLLIVAESETSVRCFGPAGVPHRQRWWIEAPGKGDFTVDADRRALGPVIAELVDERAAVALHEGDLQLYRLLHASRESLLEGTGEALRSCSGPPESLDAWMKTMRFASVRDGARTGWTPLRYAALAGRLDLARALLDAGADVEAPLASEEPRFELQKGSSILMTACQRDHPDLVRLLLDRHADPRYRDATLRSSALSWACAGGCTATIDALLERDPTLAELGDRMGVFPYNYAQTFGRDNVVVHCLAKHGAVARRVFVDSCNACGASAAAMCSYQVGDVPTLRTVLDAGAPVDAVGAVTSPTAKFLFRSARIAVRFFDRPPRTMELLGYAVECPALHQAAYAGNIGVLRLLIERGADVRSRNHPRRMSALHLAALAGHLEVVAALLKAGADANSRDGDGRTPAWYAARRGLPLIVEALRP